MRRLGAKKVVDVHDFSALPARRATSADQCFILQKRLRSRNYLKFQVRLQSFMKETGPCSKSKHAAQS